MMMMMMVITLCTCVCVVRSVARLAAEGDDGTVRMRWTPPSDVTASDVTSLTVYWCLAASSKRGACAVSLRCRLRFTLTVVLQEMPFK